MAERLTEKNKISCFEYDLANFEHKVKEFNDYDAFYAYNMAVRKLGKLEDILEKYGIDVEELEKKLANFDNFMKGNKFETYELIIQIMIQIMLEDKKGRDYEVVLLGKILSHTKKQLDTWKRACELAVLWIAQELKVLPKNIKKSEFEFEDEMIIEENTNYFYQQAKKEGEHGN